MIEAFSTIIIELIFPIVALGILFIWVKKLEWSLKISWIVGVFTTSSIVSVLLAVLVGKGDKEWVEAIFSAVTIPLMIVVIFLLWKASQKLISYANVVGYTVVFLFGARYGYILWLKPFQSYRISGNWNTDVGLDMMAGYLAILVLAYLLVSMKNSFHAFSMRWIQIWGTLLFSFFLLDEVVSLVQLIFLLGYLPITIGVVRFFVPWTNSIEPNYFYLYFTLVLIQHMKAWLLKHPLKSVSFEGKNPAQKRKIKSILRSHYQTLISYSVILAFIATMLTGHVVVSGQTPEISEAIPITANDHGTIDISIEELSDGKLHRYSYTNSSGEEARFLVIEKGQTGIYGVGFDYCLICGPTGYYQDGDNVICIECQSIINIDTIGFNGGCNPLPLSYQLAYGNVQILVDDLNEKISYFD